MAKDFFAAKQAPTAKLKAELQEAELYDQDAVVHEATTSGEVGEFAPSDELIDLAAQETFVQQLPEDAFEAPPVPEPGLGLDGADTPVVETELVGEAVSIDLNVEAELQVDDPGLEQPELATDVEIEQPELATDVEIEQPELTTDVEIEQPELATDVEIEQPELTTDVEIEQPELATDVEIEQPELTTDVEVEQPELTTDVELEEPELATDVELEEPEDEVLDLTEHEPHSVELPADLLAAYSLRLQDIALKSIPDISSVKVHQNALTSISDTKNEGVRRASLLARQVRSDRLVPIRRSTEVVESWQKEVPKLPSFDSSGDSVVASSSFRKVTGGGTQIVWHNPNSDSEKKRKLVAFATLVQKGPTAREVTKLPEVVESGCKSCAGGAGCCPTTDTKAFGRTESLAGINQGHTMGIV